MTCQYNIFIFQTNYSRNPTNFLKPNEYDNLLGDTITESTFIENTETLNISITKPEEHLTLKHYLLSIVHMPFSLRILCLTNFFCWSAHVSYSLYFTDFVGEAVFGGNPSVNNIHSS